MFFRYLFSGLLLASLFAFLTSCTRIEAGKEGILIKQYGTDKGVQDVALVTGYVWYNPFIEDVEQYPTFLRTADFKPFKVNAKDGSEFIVDPTLSFNVQTGKSPFIFKRHRKNIDEITETTIYNSVKDAYRMQMNAYTTDQLISSRKEFETAVENKLDSTLRVDGFKLDKLTSGLIYPKALTAAINAKNTAVQKAKQVEIQLLEAEAKARITIVQAEADAKANELRQHTLTPLIIQKAFIDKWNGSASLYGASPVTFKNVN